MDDRTLHEFLKETTHMAASQGIPEAADSVLEELQKAVQDHERILARQAMLIKRLREELKDVRR